MTQDTMVKNKKELSGLALAPKTIKVSASTHEQLRVIAFKKNIKIKAVVELLLKEYGRNN